MSRIRESCRVASTGRKHTEETKTKMRKSRTDAQKENYHLAAVQRSQNPDYIEKLRKARKGYKASSYTKEKISSSSRGRKMPCRSSEYREKLRNSSLAFWRDPIKAKERWRTFCRKPTSIEVTLEKILERHFPTEWKYVGNGEFILAGKCPDFVNINGSKALIELYGDYWHRNDNPQDRIDLFAKYGYSTLVIWEHELKEEGLVIDRIRLFMKELDITRNQVVSPWELPKEVWK